MMERQPVESTNIASVGFDADSSTLEVEFKGGRRHRYFGVQPETFEQFMQSESKGSFFAHNIRTRYENARVEEDREAPQDVQ